MTEPIVMGHESSGEVIAVGDLVTSHKIGDRVASEPCPHKLMSETLTYS